MPTDVDATCRRLGALGVIAGAWVTYALATAPGPYLLDSAELAEAAYGLGIAHPPGEPVAALWGKLWTLLPLGSVAFRVGLGQAAAGAVAAWLVYVLALRVAAQLDPGGRTRAGVRVAVAAATALVFAFAPGSILSADRPEVYALQTALSLGALALAWKAFETGDGRPAVVAALLIGLGLGTHPLVAGLCGAGAVVAALPLLRRPERRRLAVLGVVALALGALALAYIPARAAADPALSWGDARSPARLWWVISAQTFAHKQGFVHRAATPGDAPFVLMDEVGVGAVLLAAAGSYLLLRLAGTRRLGLALLVAWSGSLAAAVIGGLDPTNPDIRGYLGPCIGTTALFASAAVVLGTRLVAGVAGGRLAVALAGGALAAATLGLPGAFRAANRRTSGTAAVQTQSLLAELPPAAALFTSQFQTAFQVGYLRTVEGQRPDVAWAHLGFVRGPGYAARMADREPELTAALEAYERGEMPLDALAALDATRPVRMEPDSHLGPEARRASAPWGLSWMLAASRERQKLGAPSPWTAATVDLIARSEIDRDRELAGLLAWSAYIDLELACEAGQQERALLARRRLEALAPGDPLAASLAARCGLRDAATPSSR